MSRLLNLKKQIILEANIKLSEQALAANKAAVTPATPAKPAVVDPNLLADYGTVFTSVWSDIRNNIVMAGVIAGSNNPNGIIQWTYPKGNTEPRVNLHKPDGRIVDQAILDNYDKMFNDKLKLAATDDTWLEPIAKSANAKNNIKAKNINFQTYIMNNTTNKDFVKNNGTEGGAFNDGVFYSVTLKALINYKLEKNYKDSVYMLDIHKPPLL